MVADPGSLGIVIGGSGNGEQIAANKVAGVRAALAWSTETARLARLHNDANVFSIGARMHTIEEAIGFVELFVTTEFSREPGTSGGSRCLPSSRRRVPSLPSRVHRLGRRQTRQRADQMPEGHTLFRLAAELDEAFAGQAAAGLEPAGPVRRAVPPPSTVR